MVPSILRWGAILSVVVAVAFAFSLRLQQPLFAPGAEPTTYCYKRIRTHDQENPSAQCFTVANGVFTEVSSDAVEAESVIHSDGYVIPGLWDGHGHLQQYGEFLHSVDLFGSQSLEDVRKRLKAYIAANPGAGSKTQWIRGVGWDQAAFGRMPTADDIEQDKDLRGFYIMLDRIDVHCSWVSQPVLDLLPSDIPDIPGGEIIREPGMGVFCDNALSVVLDIYPEPGPQAKAKAVKTAMRQLNSVGLVGMHNAGSPPADLKLFNQLADNTDDWTVRVYNMLECDVRNTFCPQDAVKVDRKDGRFTVRSVKLFADGALGSWGSAMIDPYTDHPWSSGSLLINASALIDVTKSWAAEGYQVNIHAIGDLANRNAIDAFEAALSQQCPTSSLSTCQSLHRFRIEHAQIIHPEDQRRMHSVGIIPSIQPTHATSDMKYAEDRLGPDRTAQAAYRMKSFLDISPVLGSDFPVEPPNPFHGIYAAVTRKSPQTGLGPGGSDRGWYAEEEALSLDQALAGFTVSPAHGAFLDGKAGRISSGAYADWVVLNEPLEDIDIEKLLTLRVRETWVAGRRVYSKDSSEENESSS